MNLSEPSISILSWNIWFEEKIENILNFLSPLNADILCLQEVTENSPTNPGIHTGQFLADALGYEYFSPTSQEWTHPEPASQCNAILTRFPIKRAERHFVIEPYTDDPPKYWLQGRTLLECEVETPIGTIVVNTTHLTYSPGFEQNELRENESRTLLKLLARHSQRAIFTGDLNSLPNSPTVKRIGELFQHCGPDFSHNSWTTKPFSYDGFSATELNYRLDYAFASADLEIRTAQFMQTDVSDHLPLFFEARLKT